MYRTSFRKLKPFVFVLLLCRFMPSSFASEGLRAYELGVQYLSQQRHDLAEKSFLQALQDPAAPVETHFQLAWLYTTTGEWKKAETTILKFLESRPDSSEAQYILGYS